jgi:DNA-binding SARP family transcriptional activator
MSLSSDKPAICNILQVSLLGEFCLRYGETAVSALDARSQSLLAYLILNRKTHTRQHLAFQFWADSTESQARTNLRKTIHKLRQNLPHSEQFLHINRQTIQWQPEASFSLDVDEFERSLETTGSQSSISNLQNSISLYIGDLLPGHYDDWILAARERLRQQYLACLEQLVDLLEAERQYQSAIRYARRLLREDPLHEAAYRRLMRLYALDGNVAGALRIYHTCNTILQRELGVHPSPATQETYERLLKKEAPSTVSLPERVPLVARESAWNKLQTIWRQTIHQKRQIVLINGEAGIGKTRLAEELLDWADRQGLTTVTSACYAAEGRLPYAPVADWLRVEEMQAVFDRMETRWLTECARLRPELLTQNPNISPPTPLTEGWQRQHFFTAVAHAILNLRQPLLLFIDDLQWCDQDTLDWLHFLLRFDSQARFMLLGTVRTEEVASDHPLLSWQQSLQRNEHVTTIQLSRLDSHASSQLAAHVTGQTLNPEQSDRLYTETEGNPLFVVEMARANLHFPVASDQLPITNLPPKVQAIIQTRLAQLSPSARELTNLAAAIGRSFTFELLVEASRARLETAVYGLDELWQRRIVREQGHDAYDFSHDKIRQVAYAGLSAARRLLLHDRIISALKTLHADNLDKVSGQLAAHYEAARQFAPAIEHYQRAANEATIIYAHQKTAVYLRRAIDLLPNLEDVDGIASQLHEQLGDVLALMKQYDEAERVFETAVFHTNSPIHQARLYGKIGLACGAHQDYEAAGKAYDQALHLLDTNPTSAKWQETWLDIQINRADMYYFKAELMKLEEAVATMEVPIEQFGTINQKVALLRTLNMLAYRRKRYALDESDIATSQTILDLVRQLDDKLAESPELFALGFAYLFSGQIALGIETLTQALHQTEQNGNIYVQEQCLTYLGIAYRFQGDEVQVKKLCERGLILSDKAQICFTRVWPRLIWPGLLTVTAVSPKLLRWVMRC